MPYRAELKRPDLKGNFPCSVCGKIFCHSSSLSRHRMQAHFKSYTCTMCNQEISSNETLRSHMFRAHQISRMFMCRCCNWAFPDKTSLHIHMQSMMRNGDPGDVHILAKSSTEGGPTPSPNPKSPLTPLSATLPSPTAVMNGSLLSSTKQEPPLTPTQVIPLGGTGIFPAMPSREELINRLRARAVLPGDVGGPAGQQSGFLASWLANNFPQMNGFHTSAGLEGKSPKSAGITPDVSYLEGMEIRMDEGSDDDESSFLQNRRNSESPGDQEMTTASDATRVEPSDSAYESAESLPILRSAITANPLNSLMYRKKLNNVLRHKIPSQEPSLANFLTLAGTRGYHEPPVSGGSSSSGRNSKSIDEIATSLASPLLQQQQQHPPPMLFKSDPQPSPAGSDSQTSSSGPPMSAGSDGSSPQKCFECQVLKGKIGLADNRNKFLDSKVSSLENKVCRLENQITSLESNVRRYEGENREMRDQCEVLERKLLACQEKAIRYLQNGEQGISCMKELLEDLLETTYFEYQQQTKKEPLS